MKVALYQLEQHLSKTLAPLYLISGDEILLVEEAVQRIRDAARHKEFNERVSITVEPRTDWSEQLFAETQSLSLFASKRIVELHLHASKPNAAAAKMLQEIVKQLSPDVIFIITCDKLDKKAEGAAWYKALDKKGVTIPVWPISLDQLPGWITQRAKKSRITMTSDAAVLLAQQVEGNLLAAAQEIEKLALLQIGKTIDANMVANTVTDNARFDIYSLVDCALSGNGARALRMLENLQAEDAEPILILWAFTREIRTLTSLSAQLQQGNSLSTLFSKYRIWEKRQPAVRQFLQKHTPKTCQNLLRQSALIDRMIKGASAGNKWQALQDLALNIAGNGILGLSIS